ncbi:MAG: hypothetical protein ACU0BK_18420, partial [Shimia sp.]|uniref:hypothetical protein n=1 Tax=Shimia sp. TaxID=1954381 RepID=UPI004058102D
HTSWSFDGRHYPDTLDFDWRAYFDPKNPAVGHDPEQTVPPSDGQAAPYVSKTNITNPEQNQIRSRPLEWLWRMAAAEWADLAADTETAAVTGPGGVSGGGQANDLHMDRPSAKAGAERPVDLLCTQRDAEVF